MSTEYEKLASGFKSGRKISGAVLVNHPHGLAIVINKTSVGVIEICEFPQYGVGYRVVVKQPELTKNGWHWTGSESPLFSSVKSAVEYAIKNNQKKPAGHGTGVFSEYTAIVGAPEFCWK